MDTVAVLLAVYNGAKYLEEQVESIMHQTYQNVICYAHDDGSTDDSKELLMELKEKYPSKMIVLEYPPTGGAKENFLSLLQGRTEPYIMFADQDDVWLPEKIEKTLAEMKKIEGNGSIPALVFTDLEVVDKELKPIAPSCIKYLGIDPTRVKFTQLLRSHVGAGCTFMLNNALATICCQPVDPESAFFMHDKWCMMIASIFGKISFVDEATVLYRQHGDNVIGLPKAPYEPESLYAKIMRNVNLVKSKEFIETKTGWTKQVRKMALELLKIENLPPEKRETLSKLVTLSAKPKFYRVFFYAKNGVLPQNGKDMFLFLV